LDILSKTTAAYTEQAEPAAPQEPDDSLIVFFGIGLVINLLVITAYFIWAYKQWGKSDKKDQ